MEADKIENILISICRAMLSAIPMVGSSLDHLTFGIKDSLVTQNIKEDLTELEKEIISLREINSNPETILAKLKSTRGFKTILKKIQGHFVTHQKELLIVKKEINQLNDRLIDKKKVEKLNRAILHQLTRNVHKIDEDQANLFKEFERLSKFLKEQLASRKEIIELSDYLREQCISLRKLTSSLLISLNNNYRGVKYAISSYEVFERSIFPLNIDFSENVFLEYAAVKENLDLHIASSEKVHLLSLKNKLWSNSYNYSYKINSNQVEDLLSENKENLWRNLPPGYVNKRFVDFIGSIEIDLDVENENSELREQAFEYFTDSIKPHLTQFRDNERFIYLENKFREISYLLFVDRYEEIKLLRERRGPLLKSMIDGGFLPNATKTIISYKEAALSSFFKTSKQKGSIVAMMKNIDKHVNNAIANNHFDFNDFKDIEAFLDDLDSLDGIVQDFKTDLNTFVLNNLNDLEIQQNILTKSFSSFHVALELLEKEIYSYLYSDDN